tara:strand:+ start:364 stop:798 length:435 start_codon:yes stop_codon:yes gene_type:complete
MSEHWLYNDEIYDPETPPEDAVGFVYRITNLSNGRKYLGKKIFWSTRRVKQKGKVRRKKVVKESDWRKYYGSSNSLKEEVKELGKDKYKREILRICKTKGECSYWEAKLQFQYDVILREDYYNEYIQCRIHSSHIKKETIDGDE